MQTYLNLVVTRITKELCTEETLEDLERHLGVIAFLKSRYPHDKKVIRLERRVIFKISTTSNSKA